MYGNTGAVHSTRPNQRVNKPKIVISFLAKCRYAVDFYAESATVTSRQPGDRGPGDRPPGIENYLVSLPLGLLM